MNLKKIERINVCDTVFEQMKQMILSGEWQTGEKIAGENELAIQFGVSRVTVRDAIHRLIGMGVLSVQHGNGTYVSDPIGGQMQSHLLQQLLLSKPQLIEVLQFRLMIEVGSAGLAAKISTEEQIAQLRDLEEKMKNAGNDIKTFADYDLQYHNTIAVISGNSLTAKITVVIQDVYKSAMEEAIMLRGIGAGRQNHKEITDAIAQHNVMLAEQRMRDHIQAVIDLLP